MTNSPDKKLYTENSTIPWQTDDNVVSAVGRRKYGSTDPFKRSESFLDLITKSGNDKSSQDPNLQIDPDSSNQMLGVKSFLSYPSDLGTNRRYHHFIVLNIYQGTSDEVRMQTRETNLATSALLAKGGLQLGSLITSGDGRTTIRTTLIEAGYDLAQADAIIENLATPTSDGLTSDERIGVTDNLLSGVLNNIYNAEMETAEAEGGGGILDSAAAIGTTSIEVTKAAFNSSVRFIENLTQANVRDNLDPANQSPRNYDQKGISGRNINRSSKEQNILRANRRYNNANVKSKDTICLYMPQKIVINDQLVYNEETMGNNKIILDALTGKRGSASALVENRATTGINDLVARLPYVGSVIGDINLQAAKSAVTRSTENPRREMMFKDVGIRNHSFTFEFAPESEMEAQTVLDIIRMLRYHAYPGLQGGGGHFFTFPAEVELTFYTIDENGVVFQNDNLPKLPRLAIQSISADFSNAGDFKTFTDAKPAFIRLDLGFTEMEQLTNEHIIHGY